MNSVDPPARTAPPGPASGPGETPAPPSFLRAYGHEVRNHVGTLRNGLYLLRLQVDATAAPLLAMMERQLCAMLESYRLLSDAERLLAGTVSDPGQRADLAELAETLAPRAGVRRGISVRAVAAPPVPVAADREHVALAVEVFVAEAVARAADDSVVVLVVQPDGTGGSLAIRYSGARPDPATAMEAGTPPASAHTLLMAAAQALVAGQHGSVRHERDPTGTASYTLTFSGGAKAPGCVGMR